MTFSRQNIEIRVELDVQKVSEMRSTEWKKINSMMLWLSVQDLPE